MPNGLFYLNWPISNRRGVCLVLLVVCFIKQNPDLIPNSADADQMPHSATSDLGLHYLPMSLLWGARHKWANCLLSTIKSVGLAASHLATTVV